MAKFDRKTTFVCYPVSAAAAFTIDPGWLTILRPSTGTPLIITGSGEQNVTARVECKYTWSVKVGDILSDTFDGRVLLVKQVERKQQRQELLCEELRRPLPDRFETTSLKAYWTNTTLTLLSAAQFLGFLYVGTPSGTHLGNAGLIWQTVSGDFDIWASAVTEAVDEFDTGTAYSLLIARDPVTGYGVGVGERSIVGVGGAQTHVRVDYTASGLVVTATTVPPASGAGACSRLQREGSRLRGFVNRSIPAGVAVDDYNYPADFWIERAVGSSQFTGSGDLQVGVGGWHTSDMSYAYMSVDAMRNWQS